MSQYQEATALACRMVVLLRQTLSLLKMSLDSLLASRSPSPMLPAPMPALASSSSGFTLLRRLESSLARMAAILSVVRSSDRFFSSLLFRAPLPES